MEGSGSTGRQGWVPTKDGGPMWLWGRCWSITPLDAILHCEAKAVLRGRAVKVISRPVVGCHVGPAPQSRAC